MAFNRQQHWQTIYNTKQASELSWTEEIPATSLSLIEQLQLGKDAAIIDVGGGDSKLVDHLLAADYTNITVLDIAGEALKKAQQRLGAAANQVNWVETDVLNYNPDRKFDLWHDRAAFHFLTMPDQVARYLSVVTGWASHLIIGTFSTDGPVKCSGLPVQQYNAQEMEQCFSAAFKKIHCRQQTHETPFKTRQQFVFCSFRADGDMQQ